MKKLAIREDVTLTQLESDIFNILLSTVEDNALNVTLRVAGGWVRDKLMGKDSKDIDIALDNISGEKFAFLVKAWMEENGYETKSVGVIEANPEQSKHIETATTFVLGLPVDFVQLRTEVYDENSRIPEVKTDVTPEEDAFRRDLTINSLFYNVNTGDVEDFTGKGIEDLKNGVIRTPLDAKKTFKDDPLRILRSVRFAARYGFDLDQELIEAARDPEIQQQLAQKISKERVGQELKGALKTQNPALALSLLKDLGLRDIVLKVPEGTQHWDLDQNNPHHELLLWDHLVKVVDTLNQLLQSEKIDEEDRVILLLAGLLHDIGKLDPSIQGTKELEGRMVSTYHGHEESSKVIAEHLLKDLKFSNKEIAGVLALISPAGRAEQLTRSDAVPSRKSLAKFVRMIGEKWKHALLLAMADEASKKKDVVEKDKFEPFLKLEEMIESADVQEADKIKPLLNGNEVMLLLNLKPGPQIKKILQEMVEVQLEKPEMSKQDAINWLTTEYALHKFARSLIIKKAANELVFDKGYLFYPVEKPDFTIPTGLKDRGEFHITVLNHKEVSEAAKNMSLAKNDVKSFFSNKTLGGEPVYLGLGRVEEDGNEAYFVVVDWPEVQELRATLGLGEKDLHITMGFKEKDIFNVSKGPETII